MWISCFSYCTPCPPRVAMSAQSSLRYLYVVLLAYTKWESGWSWLVDVLCIFLGLFFYFILRVIFVFYIFFSFLVFSLWGKSKGRIGKRIDQLKMVVFLSNVCFSGHTHRWPWLCYIGRTWILKGHRALDNDPLVLCTCLKYMNLFFNA